MISALLVSIFLFSTTAPVFAQCRAEMVWKMAVIIR
jgi:hypothetical protein